MTQAGRLGWDLTYTYGEGGSGKYGAIASGETTHRRGTANMSSAILIVRINGENVDIDAYAKKGLINQHTAEGAIKRLVDGMRCQA